MNPARLSVSVLALMAILLVGCSKANELRTSAQSSGASKDAARVWNERDATKDLGATLRSEGEKWACQFAEGSIRLRKFGVFTSGDREKLASTASVLGASNQQIAKLLSDVLYLSVSDLEKVTKAACP